MKKKVKKISEKLIVKHKDKIKEYLKKHKDEIKKIAGVEIPIAEYYYIGYKVLEVLKIQNDAYTAEELLGRAIKVKQKAKYYYVLGMILKRKKKWWQSVEALSKAIESSDVPTAFWYKHYAEVLGKMNRFTEASVAWEKAIKIGKPKSDWYFAYGDILKKANEKTKSDIIFDKAIKLDKSNNSKELGLGIFYEKKGHWIESLKEYKKEAKNQPNNALITYKLGLSYDRCYDWKKAEEAYLDAILLSPESIDWYYRLGFVRERQGNWKKASEAYMLASFKHKNHTPYWFYRLGYVLNKAEDYKKSCEAFLMMKKINISQPLEEKEIILDTNGELIKKLEEVDKFFIEAIKNSSRIPNDTTDLKEWDQLLQKFKKIKDYETVECIYKEILARTEEFNGDLWFELGHILTQQGKYKEASEAFKEYRILKRANGVSESAFNKNKGLKKIISYTQYYEEFNMDEKTIMYESYHGKSISCNPYALFKTLYNDERFKNYKHVFVINDKKNIPIDLKKDINLIFISRDSDLYMRYLSKAKYLINNSTFPPYYIRKERQVYINTWHGTPIKYMGKDIKNDLMSHTNVAKNFLHATHLIQPNEHTTDILTTRHDVDNIYTGIVAETGYPRQDLMLNISGKEKKEYKNKLGIESNKKVVLYAPTWRGTFGEADFNATQLEEDIKKLQEIKGIHLLFRGHYAVEKAFNVLNTKITVVPSEIDTNSLLSIVDILITDYSSIAFDFMALARPIIYYTYDKKEYEKERGLYFPIEELGGEICTDKEELKTALEKAIINKDINQIQKNAQNKFCSHDDGKASKRVIELVFFDKNHDIVSVGDKNKKSILLYGGDFNPNGINTSFINLLNHIDRSKYNITIVVDSDAVKSSKKRLEQFNRLNKDIKIIGRVGRMTMTIEEQWIKNKFDFQNNLESKQMWSLYKSLFRREFKRIFGCGKFDSIIEFNGYGIFWPSLFGYEENNTIYLHNDMYGEWKLRFPVLEKNFRMYWHYNTVVAVSEKTMDYNIENLSSRFELDKEKFKYCDNVQNPEDSLIRAEEAVENPNDDKIFKNTKVFINIARLSPEKDQEKLIKAFKKVSKLHPEARLINLGSGPLEHQLKSLVKELSLQKKVFLLGQRSNPYPYLKKSDCFILSSNHEGQPMTLFEAMILKKPIIATDIVGNKSVLEGREGLLVENSEDGLYQGMLDFLEGRYIEEKTFDYEEYNQNALNMFYEKVVRV